VHAVHSHPHMYHLMVLAARACARSIIVAGGLGLFVAGLGLCASVVMLPVGVLVGLAGIGLTAYGAVGDLPIED
jgi:hypothetical protein